MLDLARNLDSLLQDLPRLAELLLRQQALPLRFQQDTQQGTMLDQSCEFLSLLAVRIGTREFAAI